MYFEKIVLGTVQLGLDYGINNSTGKPSVEEALSILDLARKSEIKFLDTAKAYGTAIQVIGKFHQKRPAFHIISKFHVHNGVFEEAEFSQDLKTLNIASMEALLFHSFADYKNNQQEISKLEQLKAEKKLNKIGVSIYTNNELEEVIDDGRIDVIQLPFNLLDNDNWRGKLLLKAKEKGKEIHVRSVFLQGLFFQNTEEVPSKLLSLIPYLRAIHEIAQDLNLTIEQLALMYVLQQSYIDKVLFGVDNLHQLQTNVYLIQDLPKFDVRDIVNTTIEVQEMTLLNPVNWK
jgi:aryl-alcohol dehydrogenase-like predicted oxidoreductase